ncbi:hypothetical protein V6N11_056406 [Hibiscus sabdariffa]|uniref:Uncharacterized protein n=1 Tax=Hibiscus sabdariffa TaxID=183260 RepID=A0ABR2T4L3_9ROSI
MRLRLPPYSGDRGLADEDRASLIDSLMKEIQCLSIGLTDVLESLSPNIRRRVEVLREIQGQHDELEAKFVEERVALEDKYQALYQPLYAKRYDIVNGVGEAEGTANEEDMDQKGVPDFWLTAMKNNGVLSYGITELDEGAFKYLKDIKCNRIEKPEGFKLEFCFNINPYFKNTLLTKMYHMIYDGLPILEKVIGTEIEWYPGKCLTQKPKEGSKNAEPITKAEDCESFFHFFNSLEFPDEDEDTSEELQSLFEEDYDVASTIRYKIIPHAVSWFTGEAIQRGEPEIDKDEDDGNEVEDEDGDVEEEESRQKNKSVHTICQTEKKGMWSVEIFEIFLHVRMFPVTPVYVCT